MFESLPALGDDPILGLSMLYRADTNPLKVDLGAGVYKDSQGHTPIMAAVLTAQEIWAKEEETKAYAPQAGFEGFNSGMINLVLGNEHTVVKDQRVVSVQTPGGSGALRIAAGMLKRCDDKVRIWVSTPTWANHVPLLGSAGIELKPYRYYDPKSQSIDFDGMLEDLQQAKTGDLILLHGCCHNPCGADLNREQWQAVAKLLQETGATPFVDVAYQGLGDGLEEDAWGLRHIAEQCPEMVIAASCSKNFGLYRERVGATIVIAQDTKRTNICRGQLMNVAREIYSMPPSHGAALVDVILRDPSLTQVWQEELTTVRERINGLRQTFADKLKAAGAGDRFDYIVREKGM
ncbi:MAG: aromatic amino acid transaminase, partial [Pontibacterium sp.]